MKKLKDPVDGPSVPSMVDRMVQKLALGATGAKRLHRRAAAVTGVYTEIVEREALLQA